MRTRIVVAVLAAVSLLPAQTPVTKPARASDIAGTWQMVALNAPEGAGEEDSFFAPYQLYQFDAKGRMKFMSSGRPFTSLALFDSAPMTIRYSLSRRGLLTLMNPAWTEPRKYTLSVVTAPPEAADARQRRAGDLLLTSGDDAQKSSWSKLLRRIS